MCNPSAFILHFGMVSLYVTLDELRTVASMFDETTGMAMPDESICSMLKLETGKYLFCFKAITMQFCGHAMAGFASLLKESVQKIDALFGRPQKFSPDIEELCASIEQRI